VRWLAWLLVAACSSGPGSPEHPRPPPPGDPPPSGAPSEQDCDRLINHAVVLGIDEQAARAEPHATPSDHEAIRRALHEDFMAGCRALSREAFRCAMAATTLAELARCQPQRTPSSSTSNNSVAPGGITPPAPRSP